MSTEAKCRKCGHDLMHFRHSETTAIMYGGGDMSWHLFTPAEPSAEEAQPAPATAKEVIAGSSLENLMNIIRVDNERWWKNLETGEPITRNVGEVLCLMHSEISEALEGHRKDLMDNHLPHRKMFVTELADLVIRTLDAAVHWCPELPEVIFEKLAYNRVREDHKEESRRLANGKKY